MSYDYDAIPARSELLLASLVQSHCGNAAGDGSIANIVRSLVDSPVTDAERAGERLRVFGWQVDGPADTLRWIYRVVGDNTGRDLLEFTLAVPGTFSDLPCRVFGLQLQITLNGIAATSPEELDCYLELVEAAHSGG
ncbi:MAG: hypothetical protein QOJ13_2096 [Gaiellales bacterium]|jgi:hypothetical protein|nr:hypothetical protein [Gaiellales bacterium]MDX6592900.1 hypothetical protein [Gaiellales bacterium]